MVVLLAKVNPSMKSPDKPHALWIAVEPYGVIITAHCSIASHCSLLFLSCHCSRLAAAVHFLQHSSSLRGNLKNFNPFFLPNQLVHLTTQQFLGIFTIKTAVNLPPSRCNLTAPYREYNLHLINIPAVAYREKVYSSYYFVLQLKSLQ